MFMMVSPFFFVDDFTVSQAGRFDKPKSRISPYSQQQRQPGR